MKAWFEDEKIMCLSEQCTEACPRFYDCIEIEPSGIFEIREMVRDYQTIKWLSASKPLDKMP